MPGFRRILEVIREQHEPAVDLADGDGEVEPGTVLAREVRDLRIPVLVLDPAHDAERAVVQALLAQRPEDRRRRLVEQENQPLQVIRRVGQLLLVRRGEELGAEVAKEILRVPRELDRTLGRVALERGEVQLTGHPADLLDR